VTHAARTGREGDITQLSKGCRRQYEQLAATA